MKKPDLERGRAFLFAGAAPGPKRRPLPQPALLIAQTKEQNATEPEGGTARADPVSAAIGSSTGEDPD
jgi:hypothetical protein